MKPQGRSQSPLTEEEREIVRKFLENNKSYAEFAKEVGLTKAQLRYRVAKYLKERDVVGPSKVE